MLYMGKLPHGQLLDRQRCFVRLTFCTTISLSTRVVSGSQTRFTSLRAKSTNITCDVKVSSRPHRTCARRTHMLGPILDRVGQFLCQRCIFLQRLASLDRTRNGMRDDPTEFLLD